jgi:transcriptional regulator with XRE-family HTH domain
MKTKNWFIKMVDSFKDDFEFRHEALILEVTEKISKRIKALKLSKTGLAERLKVSPPAVSKILNGNSNFTLKTLLSISDALDTSLSIEFKEKQPIVSVIPCTVWGSSANESEGRVEDYDIFTKTYSSVYKKPSKGFAVSDATSSTPIITTESKREQVYDAAA